MITDTEVRRYVDDGYVVVEQLVEPAVVEQLRCESTRFARGEYRVSNPPELAPDATDEEIRRSILAVHFPHWVSPVSLAAVRHPGVTADIGRLAGAHLPHWDGSAKAIQSMLFMKPPGKPGQAWHQDEHYIPTRDRSLVAAWIALDDTDRENGCLWVLPGSHRPGVVYPTRPHGNPEFDFAEEAFGFDDTGEAPVEVQTGDVVFFNGYLLHRSRRNRSATRYRRAFVTHYMTAASLLPWRTTDAGSPIADLRDVIPVTGADPLAGKGYDAMPTAAFLRPEK